MLSKARGKLMSHKTIQQFSDAIKNELERNLIRFWLEKSQDNENAGFIGLMTNDGRIDTKAPKGLILNTRILWSFSTLYRYNKDTRWRDLAKKAFDYIEKYFKDHEYGGTFWQLYYQGNPIDDTKKIYGQAFYIYAMTEYYLAFNDKAALESAKQMFDLIEKHSHDDIYGGYIEVCNRDWSIAKDARLSDKDMAEKKSMNNHLHLLEAYTNYFRVRRDEELKQRLIEIFDMIEKHIVNPVTGHMNHFFDETWKPKSSDYTFGHDIEASWLLYEAAEVLNDKEIKSRAKNLALRMAKVTLAEGFSEDGGLCYAGEDGKVKNPNCEWWPQAESVVGFLNAYQLSSDESFLKVAMKAWDFLEKYFVDKKNGEWFWRIFPDGHYDPNEPKVSEWKGPYHSVRACLESLARLSKIAER